MYRTVKSRWYGEMDKIALEPAKIRDHQIEKVNEFFCFPLSSKFSTNKKIYVNKLKPQML